MKQIILTTLKPQAFQAAFASWIASLVNADAIAQPIIAIDGKTMRRSHDRSDGLGPLHVVSAWSTENGLTLGQVATEEKSNEITAIPELIDQLDVKDAIVTIDAMGCQKKIAKKIVGSQADYVLAVKDNQPKLHEAIRIFSARSAKAICYRCKFGDIRRRRKATVVRTNTVMCWPRSRTISR